ncbi:MAG: ribonuclease [Actinomycetota bacterium]
MKPFPTTLVERRLLADGAPFVIGLDEVGKGAWAGPLVIGAAVLPRAVIDADDGAQRLGGARDSKQLSEKKRESIFDLVAAGCAAWSIGVASNRECDELGMNEAQRVAAARALAALGDGFDSRRATAIIDGKWDFVSPHVARVETMVKADAACLTVAAASVLAKVTRDRAMRALADDHPHWSLATNKGYPCPKHRRGLLEHGPSELHRVSWAFMDNLGVPHTPAPR